MYGCMDVWMYGCMYVCVSVCKCMYVCMHACMYVCMHVCMYAFMDVCMYVGSVYVVFNILDKRFDLFLGLYIGKIYYRIKLVL